jgi:hypothetical protein
MNRFVPLWALLLGLFLVGCANTPRFDLDLSLTDASRLATEPGVSAGSIQSQSPGYMSSSLDGLRQGLMVSADPYDADPYVDDPYVDDPYVDDPYVDDPYVDDPFATQRYDNRLLIGTQSSLEFGISRYDRQPGYQLAYAARFDASQMRVALFYADAQFPTASTAGLTAPVLLGLDLDLQWLFPMGDFSLAAGGRLTWGQMLYEFQNPLTIDGNSIEFDGIGYFGIGTAVGLQSDLGPLTFEVQASPTLYFHNSLSNVGFTNNVVNFSVNMPVSIGVGVVF